MIKWLLILVTFILLTGCSVHKQYVFKYYLTISPAPSGYTVTDSIDRTLQGKAGLYFDIRNSEGSKLTDMTLVMSATATDTMQQNSFGIMYHGYDTIAMARNYKIYISDLMQHTPLVIPAFQAKANTKYRFSVVMGALNGPISIHSRRPLTKAELDQINADRSLGKSTPLEEDGTCFILLVI